MDELGCTQHEALHSDVQVVVERLTDPSLKAMVTSHMRMDQGTGAAPCAWRTTIAVWERYAIDKFDGRLLPGCCYPGCTTLEGVSELALPMRFCAAVAGGLATAASVVRELLG